MQATAQDNELLDQLCLRHLGRTDGAAVEATLALNPGLAAQGPHLRAGQTITLAKPARSSTRATIQLWD